jgi:hypothetical protein
MSHIGEPTEWINFIDTMVPEILELISASWLTMPALRSDAHEDPTTEELCRLLRQNRGSADLPFQIHIQMVELDPEAGQDHGRMDIAFIPLVPREDIYFCLECKRLNVVRDGAVRPYATEYVTHGMMRFVRGQYAKVVHHGGMLGYVLDRDVGQAIGNVSAAIQARRIDLRMDAPGVLCPSTTRPYDPSARETLHQRSGDGRLFQIHHLFAAAAPATA